MKKEYIISPADAKEYIGFQFEGLAATLEQFDYQDKVAKVVRATCAVFNKSEPDSHQKADPDCVLLAINKTHD